MDFSELTTMRVGGPARELVTASSVDELVAVAREAWAMDEPWLVLGGGSNLVVADEGFDGTVVRVRTRGVEVREGAASERTVLRVQAGEPWDAVVAFAVEAGLGGIEGLSGIPGSSGAAPIQNIGAYGQELSDTLVSIEFLDLQRDEVVTVPADELDLAYRTSAIKQGREGVVLSIDLALNPGDSVVHYEQLASALGVAVGDRMPLPDIRAAVLALRAGKGMVLDPADPDSVSCGSFFTNPIVSENFARGLPAATPQWLMEDDTSVKLSAAWLIEQAGVPKGFGLPGSRAAISTKHTLAITNRGGASAEQVGELARYVRSVVLARFGVLLQVEPVAVGLEL